MPQETSSLTSSLSKKRTIHNDKFSGLFSTLLNGQFSDLTVVVGKDPSVPFRLHKLIMTTNSGYFAKLFGNTTSAKFKESQESVVNLPSEDPDVFERMIFYFYGSWAESETMLEAAKLYAMADYFDAAGVKRAAMEDINKKVEWANLRIKSPDRRPYRIVTTRDSVCGSDASTAAIRCKGERLPITSDERQTADVFGFHAIEKAIDPNLTTITTTTSDAETTNNSENEDIDDAASDTTSVWEAKEAVKRAAEDERRECFIEELIQVFIIVCGVYHQEDDKLFKKFIKGVKSTGQLREVLKREDLKMIFKGNPGLLLKVVDILLS